MFRRIGNKKRIILSMLFMVLLICGTQGVSYGQELSVSLSGPSDPVELGASFNLTATITNTGPSPSTPTRLSVYRSTGPGFGSETFEFDRAVAVIAGGRSSVYTLPLTAQNTAATYRYRVDLVERGGDTGANNSASVDVTVTATTPHPDPVATTLEVVSGNGQRARVNQQLASPLVVRVKDQNDAPMPGVFVSFSVTPIATLNPSSARTGSNGQAQTRLTLGSTAGTYTVTALAAGITQTVTFTVTATPTDANLSVSVVPSSSSVVPRQNFYLNTTVRNTGTATSGIITLQAYQRSGTTDVLVGASVTLQPIAGNSGFRPWSIPVTAPTVLGTYAYLVKISDTNISSPLVSVTVTNPVDLSVDTPSVEKSTVAPGETFTLSTTVRNIGTGNFTSTTTLRYFRSTDTTLNRTDGTDTEVGTDTISTLSGYSGTTAEDITVTAPSQPGTYYYFAYVKPVLGEGGRTANNTSSYVTVTVSAPPDLTVSLYRLRQATFAPGERFTLDAIVRNEGTGGAAATQLRVYEDIDDRLGREQLITRHTVSAISAGNSSTESIPLTAPPDAGLYYYRVCVDTVTGETETDDNCSNRISIEVLEPLVLASLQPSKFALASGESFTLTATIKNDGDARSAATTVQYYRSSNNSLSSSDTRVGSRSVSALAAGGTTQVSIPLSAPQAPGTYYYGACVGDSQTYSGDACAIIKLTVLAVILPASERPPMYWIDGEAGAIQSLTGSRVQRLVQSVQNATGIAVDAAAGKIYWIEKINNRSGRIRSANLNGTNVRLVASLTSAPMGIAVDVSNKRLYITNGWGKVQRFDVDGRNFRADLITGLSAPRGIAVDAAGGRIYWTEQTSRTTGKLQSADLNGANVRVVLREFAGLPNGIAVDSASGRLYMANAQGQVQRLNLDGSGFQSQFIPNLVSPQSVAVDAAASKIYWTEAGSIRRANLDGTNRQNVVTGLGTPASLSISSAPVEVLIPQSQRPPIYLQTGTGGLQRLTGATVSSFPQAAQNATGLAVDAAAGKIYWIEKINNRSGRIRSANLNGTNVRLVASLTSAPMGIAVDVSNKRLYITNGWGKVQRFDVDGRNFRSDLITGLSSPQGIAVDAAGGRIYWTEQTSGTTGKLQSANLNGGNVRLVASLTSAPMGIAVDVSNKRLYITNGWGKVQRFDVDGRNFRSDLITGLSSPQGIAVDAAAGRIYWTARGKIQRANLDGTNVQDVVRGLSGPVGIALNVSVGRSAAAAPSAAAMAPNATALHANYPNPFNPETWIPYQLREAADVHISIYDQRGVLVRELSLGHQVAGQYLSRSRAAYWDGRNQVGEPVASGLYFYTLTAGEFTATRKMLIVK